MSCSAALAPRLAEAGLAECPNRAGSARFRRLLELLRPRAKRLPDFVDQARPLLVDEVDYEPEAIEKHLSAPGCGRSHRRAERAPCPPSIHSTKHLSKRRCVDTAAARGIKAGALIHATRVAVTGRTTSPGLFEVLALLGRDTTLARLDRLEQFLLARA